VDKFFGSPDYISPEVIKSELNHPSRDIWSLGVIAYEIMIGVTPFTGMEVQEVFQNILKGDIDWP
jgi:serine/threonine protein kinase